MKYVTKTFTVELVSDRWDLGAPLRSSEDAFHYARSIYQALDADKEHFLLIVQPPEGRSPYIYIASLLIGPKSNRHAYRSFDTL